MTKNRLPYSQVYPIALHIKESLEPFCERIEIAGSLRRKVETIGDIEIVARPRRNRNIFGDELINQETQLDSFLTGNEVKFRKRGPLYQQFNYGSVMVDLFLPTIETWGSVLAIRTGSADFSRWLVTSQAAGGAMPEGVTAFGGRLFYNQHVLLTREEEDVFKALGVAWIPPEKRTGWMMKWEKIDPVWIHPVTKEA